MAASPDWGTPTPTADSRQAVNPGADVAGGGSQILLNGQLLQVPWRQLGDSLAIADYGLVQQIGLELLNSSQFQQQPVRWFSGSDAPALALTTGLDAGYRFLDITTLAQRYGWTVMPVAGTLQVTLPPQQISALRSGVQPWGDRIVVELTGPTAWRLVERGDGLTLDLLARAGMGSTWSSGLRSQGRFYDNLQVTAGSTSTSVQIALKGGARPQVTTLANPARLVIDLRLDSLQPRSIAWAPGMTWHQDYIPVNGQPFATYWLAVDLRQTGLQLRPIWTDPATAVGIAPLITTAQRWQAAAAINGGFFNRNNQYPLGAVRRDGNWISGPILGRGVFAWNDSGETQFDRLLMEQTLTTGSGQSFAIKAINSGYVEAGIGLYTAGWGATYRSILDNEVLVTVVDGRVVSQQPGGASGSTTVPIPAAGFVLAVRSYTAAAQALALGQTVSLTERLNPAGLEAFPHLIGGGPLLLKNRGVVLNAAGEQFSAAFASQAALRSAVGRTASGQILLVTVHPQPGGRGPTLAELAQVMVQLGATDALNLDGGSSSSLYLGGQLLNRPPSTAARVQNGLGLFLAP